MAETLKKMADTTPLIEIEDYHHNGEPVGSFAWGAHPAGEFLAAVMRHLKGEWEAPAGMLDSYEERSVQRGFWTPDHKSCLPTDPEARPVTFLDWGDA